MKEKTTNPIEMKLADATDECLEEIVSVRKKYKEKEREFLIKSLYYTSNIDSDYSEVEKSVVESTACTLGFNKEKLNDLVKDLKKDEIPEIPEKLSLKFKNELFCEMVTLTYLKGYQVSTEDEKLKYFAKKLGINDKKAEQIQEELYYSSQGVNRASIKSTAAKVAIGVGAVAVGATICALTAGAAAPAIGAALGNAAGFYGAAAAGHGLALLGGGAIAAGGAGVAGGTMVVVTAGGIIGGTLGALGASVKDNISNAYDKKQLKEHVKKMLKEDKTKQEILDNLIESIKVQKERISALEREFASKRDIEHAKEVVENLESQKTEVEKMIEKENETK